MHQNDLKDLLKQILGPTISDSIGLAAAAAAKSLPLCDPIDGSPPGSPVPGILQARTLEWVTSQTNSFLSLFPIKFIVKQYLCLFCPVYKIGVAVQLLSCV